ncbi:MAG: peptide chain release factor N(5)-glutamine methyltransferase [Candidatus Saccharibacteria bacterium]
MMIKSIASQSIKTWLQIAVTRLTEATIPSARLDAELILAHALGKDRTYLHAHSDDQLASDVREIIDAQLTLRLDHLPIAYITGHKEFYGRRFSVTADTLIPRPESEAIIDSLKDLMQNFVVPKDKVLQLVDVGTGSGCLGITAKLELPHLEVTLSDISGPALAVAQANATRLRADVTILESDLLNSYRKPADVIIANLPYVDLSWKRSPETVHEPSIALFAGDGGQALINQLIDQSIDILATPGLLILEADPSQHESIIAYASHKGFLLRARRDYSVAMQLS